MHYALFFVHWKGYDDVMSLLLLIFLIGVPALEIYLFILVGGVIGGGWTIIAIIATAMIGLSLMRRQGLAVWAQVRAAQGPPDQTKSKPPIAEVTHGILILVAGALLVTPGFMTDIVGFLLLWRGFRLLLIASILEAALTGIYSSAFSGSAFSGSPFSGSAPPKPDITPDTATDTIEGEYWSSSEDDK